MGRRGLLLLFITLCFLVALSSSAKTVVVCREVVRGIVRTHGPRVVERVARAITCITVGKSAGRLSFSKKSGKLSSKLSPTKSLLRDTLHADRVSSSMQVVHHSQCDVAT